MSAGLVVTVLLVVLLAAGIVARKRRREPAVDHRAVLTTACEAHGLRVECTAVTTRRGARCAWVKVMRGETELACRGGIWSGKTPDAEFNRLCAELRGVA